MSRLVYLNLFLAVSLTDWLLNYFKPEENAGNWLAAAFGAFVIRLAYPKLPFGASLLGWLGGFIIACLFAPSVIDKGGIFGLPRPEVNWGTIALLGDMALQLVAWIMRIVSGVGKYAEANPGAAFDEGLERVEKVTTVWLRIKAPFMDLLNSLSGLFGKKS